MAKQAKEYASLNCCRGFTSLCHAAAAGATKCANGKEHIDTVLKIHFRASQCARMGRRGQGREKDRSGQVSQLEDLMRRRGVDQAWDALDEMMRAGLPSDRFTVSRMLMRTLADGRKNWDAAKINRSVALVEQFVQQQPQEADEVLFNAMLDTHSRTKDIARLEATYQRMQDLGVEPSHVTLGILVKAYGQVCDIKKVLQLWNEMKEQRTQANAVTYGCMINACVKCSQTEKAQQIFRDMQKHHKQSNTILYTTLIKGCGNEKDLNSAVMLFREMKDEGVPYNTIAYNSIIDVCIKCSEVVKAEEFFQEMSDGTVQPDLITYSTLLKGYCQVGDLDKALQVAATIKGCGMQCDELVYNTLMDGCVKANDLSAGVGLFAEMASAGMKPSSITHSIFLRLYQRNGYKGNAMDAVAQLYQHHGLEKPSGTVEKFRQFHFMRFRPLMLRSGCLTESWCQGKCTASQVAPPPSRAWLWRISVIKAARTVPVLVPVLLMALQVRASCSLREAPVPPELTQWSARSDFSHFMR